MQKLGKCEFNIQDLINFAEENSHIPDDEDEVFVSAYEHELDPNMWWYDPKKALHFCCPNECLKKQKKQKKK